MKIAIITLHLLLFLAGIARGEKKPFTIDGTAPELKEGEMLVLTNRVEGVDTLGRASIANGTFHIEGMIEEPCVALLKVADKEGGFVFLLDSDAPYEMELWNQKPSVIKGGKLQEELNAYQKVVAQANEKMAAIRQEIDQASAQRRFKTVNELREKLEKENSKARSRVDAILERNGDNLFSVYIRTAGMEQMPLPVLKELYASLSEEARHWEQARLVEARIAALEHVDQGAVAPDFTLPTPDGREVSLYALKGKLKIIDFWASWCGPCRLENPNMVKLYADFKDKGLTVVSVSLDNNKASWQKAIEDDGLTWIHVSDLKGWSSPVIKQFNIDAVPTIFVLDENNRIVAKNLRGEALRAFVSERLK